MRNLVGLALLLLLIGIEVQAEDVSSTTSLAKRVEKLENFMAGKKFSAHGHFQFRTESAENRQGTQQSDQLAQSFSRMRVYFQFQANEKLRFNYTPQATKGFGELATGSTTQVDDNDSTSGSTDHTEVSAFESNVEYDLNEKLTLTLGKKELDYGDAVVIGSLPWANNGRSFDVVQLSRKIENGKIDFVHSKISNNDTNVGTNLKNDDKDLYFLYGTKKFDSALKVMDLYLIHQNDNANEVEVNMVGFRAKVKIGEFFFNTESAAQSGENLGDEAFSYIVEAGGKFGRLKASMEVNVAGPGYIQLYPTAHKFLGFADVLGRRNIEDGTIHFQYKASDDVGFRLDFHNFKRNDDEEQAYKLDGSTGWGLTGDQDDDIGREVDFIANIKTKNGLKLQLGYCVFTPDGYLRDVNSGLDDQVVFSYAMVNAGF